MGVSCAALTTLLMLLRAPLASSLGLVGYTTAMLAHYFLAVPTHRFDPVASRYLGDVLYLTFHTNFIGTIFMGVAVIDGTLQLGFDRLLWTLLPLPFAMGIFMTLAYYSLDHFNIVNFQRKERHRAAYPHVHICSHLEHAHSAPLVIIYALCAHNRDRLVAPSDADASLLVAAYMLFYIALVHANNYATGAWPYAIIDDVTRKGGSAARGVFFVVLSSAFVGLALGGLRLMRW